MNRNLQVNKSYRPPEISVKAVVFDMDGLMLNTEDLYDVVGSRLLARRGLLFSHDIKRSMMGRKATEAFEVLRTNCGLADSVDSLITESDELMRQLLDSGDHLAQMPGLGQLLAFLEAKRIPKAVATSSSRKFADRVLGNFNLTQRFEFVLCGDDVLQGKPNPEIYLTAAARLAISATEMLVLEDSVLGSQAAVAAGAFTVAVPSQPTLTGDFDHVQLVVTSLESAELTRLFG